MKTKTRMPKAKLLAALKRDLRTYEAFEGMRQLAYVTFLRQCSADQDKKMEAGFRRIRKRKLKGLRFCIAGVKLAIKTLETS